MNIPLIFYVTHSLSAHKTAKNIEIQTAGENNGLNEIDIPLNLLKIE
jgi:hypothetical protein